MLTVFVVLKKEMDFEENDVLLGSVFYRPETAVADITSDWAEEWKDCLLPGENFPVPPLAWSADADRNLIATPTEHGPCIARMYVICKRQIK